MATRNLHDGDTFEATHDGVVHTFRFNAEQDDCLGPPWEEHDGHGVVSEWTSRDKRPGERILNSDHGSHRYYDIEASLKIAKRDGWGLDPAKVAGKTPGQIRALAVDADYEHLRAWCNDEWCWMQISVTLLDEDGEDTHEVEYLSGIDGDSDGYLTQCAYELAGEIAHRVNRESKERAYWEARDVVTN